MESKLAEPEASALDTDTIAAVATPAGVGGIGVVRISGPAAIRIGRAITSKHLSPRRATRARFSATAGEVLDDGIAIAFPGPHSFTGEDVVELQGHGGPVVQQLVLDAVLSQGARLARPGEFTERAFMNGKIDLVQAEAVADLIASASAAAARGALRSLQGEFSRAVAALDRAVLELRVFVEAAMDFPEEGDDFLAEGRVEERLTAVLAKCEALEEQTRQGVLLKDGIAVALLGAPNVGKSSLLNRLAGEERAIVTDIPGTTRDVIPVDLVLDGLPIQIVDTAGLRESLDPVEQEGVRRAREQGARADLVLMLTDDRGGDAGEGERTLASVVAAGIPPSRVIQVRNKIDLTGASAGSSGADPKGIVTVRVSALTGSGVETLVTLVKERAGFAAEGTTFTARRRHVDTLKDARAALERALGLYDSGAPPELVAEELRAVHHALGSIVGLVSTDELLGEIFASFCIGK